MTVKTKQIYDFASQSAFLVRHSDLGDGSFAEFVATKRKTSILVTITRPADTTPYTAKDNIGVILNVTAASNATPIVITCGTHGLADGDPVTVASVGGNTNANGNFFAKVTGQSATTFALYSDKALTTPVAGNSSYTSGGTVGRLFRFPLAAPVGGSGSIVKAAILTDQTSNTETFRLHLFNAPPTILQDNAACSAPLFADRAKYIGTLDFPAARTEGGGTAAYANSSPVSTNSEFPLPFICAAADQDLYGMLETPTGFTPASAQNFAIQLIIDND